MNIYKQIISHVFKSHSINKYHINDEAIIDLFVNRFCSYTPKSKIHETHAKFIEFKYFILKNFIFNSIVSEYSRNKLLDLFCKAQSLYLSLVKFKRVLLFKSKRYLDTQLDLNFSDLSSYNKSLKIDIIHENTKYIFSISDLIRIINASLSYDVNFFPEPTLIKNPWNNKPFKKTDLYNIYFFISNSKIPMPILFSRFFQANFNLKNYEIYNQFIIKDYIIENCHNLSEIQKYKYILEMILYYNNNTMILNKLLHIDSNFPKSRLHEIFNPYIKLYLLARYSYEDDIRLLNRVRLFAKLKLLKRNNTLFGRKMVCCNIKKLYYISLITHNKDDIIFKFPSYIPPPSMICVNSRSFYIDYIPSINNNYSYFCEFDNRKTLKINNLLNRTNNTYITIKDVQALFVFINNYVFTEKQNNIIRDKYHQTTPVTSSVHYNGISRNNSSVPPMSELNLNNQVQNEGDDIINQVQNEGGDNSSNDDTIVINEENDNELEYYHTIGYGISTSEIDLEDDTDLYESESESIS